MCESLKRSLIGRRPRMWSCISFGRVRRPVIFNYYTATNLKIDTELFTTSIVSCAVTNQLLMEERVLSGSSVRPGLVQGSFPFSIRYIYSSSYINLFSVKHLPSCYLNLSFTNNDVTFGIPRLTAQETLKP